MKKKSLKIITLLGVLFCTTTLADATQCLTYEGYKRYNGIDKNGRVKNYKCTLKYKPLEFGMDYYCENDNCTEDKLNKAIRAREKDLEKLNRCDTDSIVPDCPLYEDLFVRDNDTVNFTYDQNSIDISKKSLERDIEALKRKRRGVSKVVGASADATSSAPVAVEVLPSADQSVCENSADSPESSYYYGYCEGGVTVLTSARDQIVGILKDGTCITPEY